jgi:hypothetical protein
MIAGALKELGLTLLMIGGPVLIAYRPRRRVRN